MVSFSTVVGVFFLLDPMLPDDGLCVRVVEVISLCVLVRRKRPEDLIVGETWGIGDHAL